MMKFRERAVWSPKHGGCIMIQHLGSADWVDWNSQDEGEFPVYDAAARKAVATTNRYIRANALIARAKTLETRAADLRAKAEQLKSNKPARRRRSGMTAYERAERSFDAY